MCVCVCMFACAVCSQGKYGLDCAQDCPCHNNGTCDRFTGTCSCTAGYYGHTCQHSMQTLNYNTVYEYDFSPGEIGHNDLNES